MGEKWTDLTIVSNDGVHFKAHRLVLAALSPLLKQDIDKATKAAGKERPELHFPFSASAIVLLLSYTHANGMFSTSTTIWASCPNGQADSLRNNRQPMRDIVACMQGYTLAHHYAIDRMARQLWPHIMRLAEQHMRLRDYVPLLRSIVALHEALPAQQYLAAPLIDLLAIEFEQIWKDPDVVHFAQQHGSLGWQMSVRLHAVWSSRLGQQKADEEK